MWSFPLISIARNRKYSQVFWKWPRWTTKFARILAACSATKTQSETQSQTSPIIIPIPVHHAQSAASHKSVILGKNKIAQKRIRKRKLSGFAKSQAWGPANYNPNFLDTLQNALLAFPSLLAGASIIRSRVWLAHLVFSSQHTFLRAEYGPKQRAIKGEFNLKDQTPRDVLQIQKLS